MVETEKIKIVIEAMVKDEGLEIDATVDANAKSITILSAQPIIEKKWREIMVALREDAADKLKETLAEAIMEKLGLDVEAKVIPIGEIGDFDEFFDEDDDKCFESDYQQISPEDRKKIEAVKKTITKIIGCDGDCENCKRNIVRK